LFHETSNSAHLNESFYNSDYAIGTVYTLRKEENDFIQLGLYYESALSFSKTAKWEGDLQTMFIGEAPPQFINPNVKLNAEFPPTLRFDFDFNPSNKIKLLGSISDVYWRTIDDFLKNQMEYSGSFDYSINKLITASIGFNFIEKKTSENSMEYAPYLNELFITAGILIKYGNINLHLAIADGQLIKNKTIEQTVFNTNISYNF
jgi:long-subunit fatty acid transport protein